MSKELTYILGAGASFQSIPVVKTFNNRFLRFRDFLRSKGQNVTGDHRKKYNQAVNSFNEIFKDFSSHQSFDTYFKKLFHLGDSNKINIGKRLLNLYFLWEHSASAFRPEQEDLQGEFKPEKFIKQSLFDKRYDALIAGLLKPIGGKSEVLCKVNFISWNYDINLLHSIKNFFYPSLNYEEFLKKITRNQFLFTIDNKINIVNVNGYFYSSSLNGISDLTTLNVDNIIQEKISNNYFNNDSIDIDADKIRFAWELNDKDENNLKELLTSIIKVTEDLIVIGYTFPVYNRFIDFGYLSQQDLTNKKIVIQDPNSESLKQNLLDVYRVIGKSKIQAVSNCDSFYLPSSVFGINEYRKPRGITVSN